MRAILISGILAATALLGHATVCGDCDVLLVPTTSDEAASDAPVLWSQGEAETNRIDILIAFDASAIQWLRENGWSDAAAFAHAAVDDMNTGLANTDLNRLFTFRLAGTRLLESDLSAVSLSAIANRACGRTKTTGTEKTDFSLLRTQRETDKADLVAVLTDSVTTNVYGSSFQMTASDIKGKKPATFAKYAYCACAIESLETRYSLLHEVGHLMGAGHADTIKSSLQPGPGAFTYSSGYNFVAGGQRWTSVMGYPKDGIHTDFEWQRLPFFSSPDYSLMLCDDATGEAHDSGVAVGTAGKNDNSRTLRETYTLVANFRVAKMLDTIPFESDTPTTPALTLEVSSGSEIVAPQQVLAIRQFVQQEWTVKVVSRDGLKTTVKVKGLPAGLKYNAKTGLVTGYAKKSGTFSVTVTATDTRRNTIRQTIPLAVAKLPDWAVGTFDGLDIWEGEPVPVALTVSSSGRISGKFKIGSRVRTASALGFATFDEVSGATALPLAVKTSATQTRTVVYAISPLTVSDKSGRTIIIGTATDGAAANNGLVQDVWMRKSLAPCTFRKPLALSLNGPGAGLSRGDSLILKLSGKGKVSVSGTMAGVRVSATSKLCRLGWQQGELAMTAVVLPAKKSGAKVFDGYSRILTLLLATDDAGRVQGVSRMDIAAP